MVSFLNVTIDQFDEYFDALCTMRLKAFKEFPYLYDGDKLYEYDYLKGYFNHPDGRIILAFQNQQIVGMISGFPLKENMSEPINVTKWFQDHAKIKEDDLKYYYYLGEVISTNPQSKIGFQLIVHLCEQANLLGFKKIAFMMIEHSKDHPLRPQNYKDLKDKMRLFQARPMNVSVQSPYNTIQNDGSTKLTENQMDFWEMNVNFNKNKLK